MYSKKNWNWYISSIKIRNLHTPKTYIWFTYLGIALVWYVKVTVTSKYIEISNLHTPTTDFYLFYYPLMFLSWIAFCILQKNWIKKLSQQSKSRESLRESKVLFRIRSVQVPNFDGTYISVPIFFGIHNISFFKFLPDLKYLT